MHFSLWGKKQDRNFISLNFCVVWNVYLRHLMKMRCYCPRLSKTPKVSELVLLSVTGLCCGHGTVLVGPGPVASLVASSEGHLGMHRGAWWQRPWFREGQSSRFTASIPMASSVIAVINCGKICLKTKLFNKYPQNLNISFCLT